MSIVLAIETSQRQGGVAVRDRKGEIHVEMLAPKKRHDDDLMPAIDRMFTRAGLDPADLQAVGVSIGPGGFTGLRIAVATAKMLAEALHARLLAVPSALVAAESLTLAKVPPIDRAKSILVALASKNETAWCASLERPGEEWKIVSEEERSAGVGVRAAEALDLANIDALVADEFLPASMQACCEAQAVPIIAPIFDPTACLLIAERMLRRGETTDPLRLLPLYPREPEAVTLWQKRERR